MTTEPIILYALLGANTLLTFVTLRDHDLLDKLVFHIAPLRDRGEYHRIITSAFMHSGWPHFFFNMIALYSFGDYLEAYFGWKSFLFLYLVSLLGGNGLSYVLNKKKDDYRALGASGAVSGVVFAFVLLRPDAKIMLFFIPIGIPGWIFGIGYVLFSLYGMQNERSMIGHDAHLGGAITGLLATIAMRPHLLDERAWLLSALLIPSVLVLIYMMTHGGRLPFEHSHPKAD